MSTQRCITDFIGAESAKGASKKKKKKDKFLIEDRSEEVAAGTTIDSTEKSPKKLKMKKKRAFEEVAMKVEPEDTEQLDSCIITKPKKKKKKKKTKVAGNGNHKSQENVSSMSPVKVPADNVLKTSMKRQLKKDSESPSSPSKMENKKQRSNSEKVVSVEDEDLEVECQNWTMEEELELLEKMKALAPKKDTKSCRVRLKIFDWDEVAFGDHSGDNCKKRFMEISARINTMKTLATIIEEAEEKVSSFASRKKQIRQPISRFYKDFLSKSSVKGPTVFALASEAWKNLPAEQKDMYQAQYQEDLKKLTSRFPIDKRTMRKEFTDANLFAMPRTPYHIWKVDSNRVISSTPTMKLSLVFAKLKKHKKVPYIYISLCEVIQFKKEVEERLKENPDFKAPSYVGPRKEHLKIYLEEKGFPEYAAQKPFQIYMQDLEESGNLPEIEEKELQIHVMEQFKRLPTSKKKFYANKVLEGLEEHRKKFLEWEQNQDDVTLFAKDLFLSGKNNLPHLVGMKRKPSKMSEVFPHKIEFGMSCPKFHDQPREPPKTPIKLLYLKFEHTPRFQKEFKTPADKAKKLKVYWNKLTEEQKGTYVTKCEELKEVYKTRLLEYVDNMDKEMCKVYLGFLRRKLYKFFGYDIFEQAYPNAKYPVFVLSLKKASKSSNDLSDLDVTDEEEEDAAATKHEENSDEDQYSDDPDGDLESEESDEERESELPTKSILSSRKGKASKLGGKTGNTDLAKGKKTQPSTQSLGKSDKLINKLVKSKPAVVSHLGNTETVSKSRSTAGNELRKATNKESHDSEDDYESDNLDQENDNDDSDQENDNDDSDQENDND
ncbi:nucleolar transcription factor 1-like, partial [Homarus americanus]|uniref:nucleolar transcription factor 1-like n=1 Tax=Homarus americanus TaxID=6706 RepID=UPI001C450320